MADARGRFRRANKAAGSEFFDARRHLLLAGISLLAVVAIAAPAIALSSGGVSNRAGKQGSITTQWVIAAGNAALKDPTGAGSDTNGCAWLTDHDLRVVWSRLTSHPFPGVANFLGQWDLNKTGPPAQGTCGVDKSREGFQLQINLFALSQDMNAIRNDWKKLGAWYPEVSSHRRYVNSYRNLSEQTSREAGARVVVTLVWAGTRAKSVPRSDFRSAIDTILSRMRERTART